MIRTGHLHRLLHRLALLATLLMVFAPLLSRALQPAPVLEVPDCTSEGLRPQAASAVHHAAVASHDGSRGDAGISARVDVATHAHDSGGIASHADHGVLCDYCVLAARLLPWLAVALLLLPLLRAAAPHVLSPLLAPAARHWPAHAPRGPPLHA